MTVVLADRYELYRRLGRGGMAEVWRGRDLVLGRRVAVKTVDVADATDVSLGDRLRREAVATAALDHPDIVTVHDAGVDGDTAYLVMELVVGRDLAAVLADGALPLAEAVHIAGRVAGALAAAHAAGIVHRDIKPANIIVNGDKVTVVDFGIAAIEFQAVTSLTAPGQTLGTAEYMSPEQARAEPATSGTDMYSFGCLLTALVAGRPPFMAEVPVAVLHHHAYIRAPRLRSLRPDVPEELDTLVAALLDKDPAARPTATEAHERLARIAASLPPAAPAVAVAPAVAPAAAPAVPEAGASPAEPALTAQSTAMHDATGAPAGREEPTAALAGVATALPGTPEELPAAGASATDRPGAAPHAAASHAADRRRRPVLVGAAAAVAAGIVAVSATAVASDAPEPVGKILVAADKVLVPDATAAAPIATPAVSAVASPPPAEAPSPSTPGDAEPSTAAQGGTEIVEESAAPSDQGPPAVTGKGQEGRGAPAGGNNGTTGNGQNGNNGRGN